MTVLTKVLEMQKSIWEMRLHEPSERVHKVVVLLSADALVLPADVERVVEQVLVVGANVKTDCDGASWVDWIYVEIQ